MALYSGSSRASGSRRRALVKRPSNFLGGRTLALSRAPAKSCCCCRGGVFRGGLRSRASAQARASYVCSAICARLGPDCTLLARAEFRCACVQYPSSYPRAPRFSIAYFRSRSAHSTITTLALSRSTALNLIRGRLRGPARRLRLLASRDSPLRTTFIANTHSRLFSR